MRSATPTATGCLCPFLLSPDAERFLPWITASAKAGAITIENLGAVNILPRGGTGTNSHTAGLLALMMISAGACVWLSVTIDPELSDDFAFPRLARQASGILTLTKYQAEIMQRYDPTGPVVTIPPAFDPTDLPPAPRRSRPIRVGFGGDRWKFEGPDLIMARNPMIMLAERDDVDLHFWGDDVSLPGRYDFGLGTALMSPFINDYMAYLREVRFLDIAVAPLHLHGGDVTDFNRSRWQGHWLEHAVFGTPLVASDLDPYDEFEDGKTILKVRTEADWFEALTSLVDNDALRLRIGRAARAHAMRHYTTEAVGSRWRDWYSCARAAHAYRFDQR